jgi:hypothetical protein
MNAENTETLFQMFPRLYRGRGKPVTESLMCFGFECGDGWFSLIRDLSAAIERACDEDRTVVPEVVQVKEKYGGLRVYIYGGSDRVYQLIDRAEEDSLRICEQCGLEGVLCVDGGGWYRTVCAEHAREHDMMPVTARGLD